MATTSPRLARQRAGSDVSGPSALDDDNEETQELGSMYDYLAKIILIGPSGAGKSCLLHRFLHSSFRPLSSQTIGVEFASKVVHVGRGARRARLKLQLWDTAGTERFRAVSRSYYRGAAGALLVYDVSSGASLAALETYLHDARALASPRLSIVLVGNKADVSDHHATAQEEGREEFSHTGSGDHDDGSEERDWASTSRLSTSVASVASTAPSFTQADSDVWGAAADDDWGRRTGGASDGLPTPAASQRAPSSRASAGSLGSTSTLRYGYAGQRQAATRAPQGREIDATTASRWASAQSIPVVADVSALTGQGVDEAFTRLATMILTKIELGEVDPGDPQSGIQYGDGGWWAEGGNDDGSSVKSVGAAAAAAGGGGGGGSSLRRRRKGKSRSGPALREWEAVFKLDGGRGKRRGCC